MGQQGIQDRPLTDTIEGQEQKQEERSVETRPTTTPKPAGGPTVAMAQQLTVGNK